MAVEGEREQAPSLRKDQLQPQLLYFFVVVLAVENIPLLAAFEDGSLLAFDLQAGETIQSTIELVGPLALQQAVTIRLQETPDWQRHVLADRQRFQQVLLNLLSNAIKYNRRGGTVTVSCHLVEDARFAWGESASLDEAANHRKICA